MKFSHFLKEKSLFRTNLSVELISRTFPPAVHILKSYQYSIFRIGMLAYEYRNIIIALLYIWIIEKTTNENNYKIRRK